MKHIKISIAIRLLGTLSIILSAVFVQSGIVHSQSLSTEIQENVPPFTSITFPLSSKTWNHNNGIKLEKNKNTKLAFTLQEISAAALISEESAITLADTKSMRISGTRIQVQILTTKNRLEAAKQVVDQSGGEVTGINQDSTRIQAWLPIDSLESISLNENVLHIQEPGKMYLFDDPKPGAYITEGLNVINWNAWQSAGYNGAGVKVAIIDGGFTNYSNLLGTDLPAAVTIKNFVDGEVDSQVNGTTIHGTACAEIIYDIAPAASLYLIKIGTDIDLQEAVNWLINNTQVDIISTSLGWYGETPGDGTGEFASIVQNARDHGIFWVTAAGNERQSHWGGAYFDPENDKWHNFASDQDIDYFGPGNGDAYLIPAGYPIQVALRWDDWSAVNQDFDLYIFRWNGSTWSQVGYSGEVQNGGIGQKPTEYAVAYSSGSDAVYGFAIECYSCSRAVNFEVFAPKITRLDKILEARSIANLADAPAAMTVAALNVVSPFVQESYSSQGPTNGTGGTAIGGFNKPDISAFANVSTASYGTLNKFNGTSSATPHVAGAAALVLSAYPSYTPVQLQSFLQSRAIDMGTSGLDTIYGYGRLYLGSSPAPFAITSITPNLALNNGIVHVAINGSGFITGSTVKLAKSGQPEILATKVNVANASLINADFNLASAALGRWNVVVTHPNTSSVQLINGFIITNRIYKTYIPLLVR